MRSSTLQEGVATYTSFSQYGTGSLFPILTENSRETGAPETKGWAECIESPISKEIPNADDGDGKTRP